jgi:excisionase family DNA binding protein
MKNLEVKGEATRPLLMSVVGAAKALSLSPNTVYSCIYSGRLPHVKVGRRTLIQYAVIEKVAEEGLQ